MLFNSVEFLLAFFPIVLVVWYGIWAIGRKCKKQRLRQVVFPAIAKYFLLIASLFFYSYFKPEYLLIILSSILINYAISLEFRRLNQREALRKLLLIVAIAFNIAVIGYYKYWDFAASNINNAFGSALPLNHVVLPLGISFFTFQQLSFVIDSYTKEDGAVYNLMDYALFVCYFPQLIAGPIVTHDELVPQFEAKDNKKLSADFFSKGLYALALGLSKKVLIADTFGNAVNYGYGHIDELSALSTILVILAYTFQIYFDFSGYCDMATGCALMMNIKLPKNFDSPYRSLSITEFWKRWHMTLTRFFTRYIYIPLGGNRKGTIRTLLNVMIVYLCSGIWHGANWTFILWGVMHGVACCADRLTHKYTEKWHPVIRWIITFVFINITWVYFRAESVEQANHLLQRLLCWEQGSIDTSLLECFFLPQFKMLLMLLKTDFWNVYQQAINLSVLAFYAFALWASVNMKNTNERIEQFRPSVWNATMTVFLLVTALVATSGVSTFLYFNF